MAATGVPKARTAVRGPLGVRRASRTRRPRPAHADWTNEGSDLGVILAGERSPWQDGRDSPEKKPSHEIGRISLLSVHELGERIALVKEEIARLERRSRQNSSRSVPTGSSSVRSLGPRRPSDEQTKPVEL